MNILENIETHLLNSAAFDAAALSVTCSEPRITLSDAEDLASEALRAGLAANTIDSVADVDALPTGSRLFSLRTNNMWTTHTNQRLRVEGTGGGYTFLHDFVTAEAPFLVLHVAGPQ